jgi:hypothetical protein
MREWLVARQHGAGTRGRDEFRRAGSSVLSERTGHLMKISHITSRQEWPTARPAKENAASRRSSRLKSALGWRLPWYSSHGSGLTLLLEGSDDLATDDADVMLSTHRFLDPTPLGPQRCINEWPWRHTYGASDRHAHHH